VLRVNFVTSIDGAAAVDGLSAGLSGEADKALFRLLRRECDALMVGAGTFRTENYKPLRLDEERRAWRVAHGLPAYPRLVLVSRTMCISAASPALAEAPVRPLILTTGDADPRDLATVAEVVRCADLRSGVAQLRRLGLEHILCEGGPHLFAELSKEDLVDELCLTVSPLLAGPGAGRITAGEPHAPRPMRLSRVETAEDGTLLLRYARRRDS
jgi:riboflavin biosynthesis pyrimidine reductase